MLQIQNLNVSVHNLHILRGVDLTVQPGEIVGVIGPNGSGKTTLFNSISGFINSTSGSITFKEQEITKLPPHKRATLGIGRVFQNSGVFRDMTVQENMVTALEARASVWSTFFPWSAAHRKYQAEALKFLDPIGLRTKAQEKAGSLSGGQLRLLEIQRTLAFGADLFLLDEPTAGVSPKMKNDVADLIRTVHSHGKTVLIIEHDLNFIQAFCNRIVVLESGRVALDDHPQKVRDNKALQEIYFGKQHSA